MKKQVRFATSLALAVVLFLQGCGGANGGADSVTKTNYLPTKIENLSTGGTLPEGYTKLGESGDYAIESLWGEWVYEDYDEEESTSSVQLSDRSVTLFEDIEDEETTVDAFPIQMDFFPSYGAMGLSMMDLYTWNSFDDTYLNDADQVTEANDFDASVEQMGYGCGKADYNMASSDDGADPADFASMSFANITVGLGRSGRDCFYDIIGNQLVLGVTDYTDGVDSVNVSEVTYNITLSGYKMILERDGQSIAYVPRKLAGESSLNNFDIDTAGPIEEVGVEGIEGVTIKDGQFSIMQDVHEGYVDVNAQLLEDGKLSISLPNGEAVFDYIYAGDALTLAKDGVSQVYSAYTRALESPGGRPGATISVNGTTIFVDSEITIGNLLGNGFSTDIDIYQPVYSCETTDEFMMYYGSVPVRVKATNIYENQLELQDCNVSYFRVDDTTGTITKGGSLDAIWEDNVIVGKSTYEELDYLYDAPYEKGGNYLKYKTTNSRILTSIPDLYSKGSRLLWARPENQSSEAEMEVVYNFGNSGILENFEFLVPAYLYNGMQDNVITTDMKNVDVNSTVFSGVIETRNNILAALRDAFSTSGISVNINEQSGEIVLDSDILFAVDSAELSAEGKAYIDSFFGVYGSVLTDDQWANAISAIMFEGHTDSTGSYDYNLDLSQRRAEAVMEYACVNDSSGLTDNQKARIRTLSKAQGYSFSNPIYDQRGEEDMDASRRAAIKFMMKVD